MKVQEAIDKINNADDIYSVFEAEDVIEGKVVSSYQDLDEYRWYSIATRVFEVEDGFVGVRGPYQSFSEMQDWSDIAVDCGGVGAFEVEPILSTYYKRKE